jgi:hypothetical protein
MTRFFTLALTLLSGLGSARAYEPTTIAGLTEKAALASSLHKWMLRSGHPLGLYEPLKLAADRELARRLTMLDPEGGYAPDGGKNAALGWLTAGAVLEMVPAARGRHHFFDPSTGLGLNERGGAPLRTRLSDVVSGIGSLRGVFTGASFDGTGIAAPVWVGAPGNEWGLVRYLDERGRAASAPTAKERDGALARALIAAGSIVSVLEQMGDPAHVRNDYRVALEAEGGRYQQAVAARFGRLALPDPDPAALSPLRLGELFHDAAGHGLADRTQRRFFSPGTLPPSSFAAPSVEAGDGLGGWATGEVKHLAAWERLPDGRIRWFLDGRCERDYADALLPEVGRYARAALDLLFRGRLELEEHDGGIRVIARELALGPGVLTLYAEDASGTRTRLSARSLTAGAVGEELGSFERPAGARRVAAVFRGSDANGEPLVITDELPLK